MDSRIRVIRALGWLLFLTGVGTVGFVAIEGLPWFDALYLAVMTMSTVGYGDLVPRTPLGRVFTTGLVVVGVGTVLYVVTSVAQYVLEGRMRDLFLRRSMMRRIERLDGHVIVTGYGRFGRVVVQELRQAGRTVVVVEEDAQHEAELLTAGVEFVIGSGTHDEVLLAAGVARAEALVVATSDEAASVFITLSARELNPELRIHARGETEAAIRRLKRAGADFVTSPYQMGGARTATSILRPSVVEFLELSAVSHQQEVDLEEVRAYAGSPIIGQTVAEVERGTSGLRVVALKRGSQSIELVPDPGQTLQANDHLVVIGNRTRLAALAQSALAPDSDAVAAAERDRAGEPGLS